MIWRGKIFVYPTDTIYGLGCDATNKEAVEKIKRIKIRDSEKPLSVIAPSFEWIEKNLVVDCDLKNYLPGAYTLVLKKKNLEFLKWVSSGDSLGVRIPRNRFTSEIQKSEVPFITTSVNIAGEKPALRVEDIGKRILNEADIIIEADEELSGKPSVLVIGGQEIVR